MNLKALLNIVRARLHLKLRICSFRFFGNPIESSGKEKVICFLLMTFRFIYFFKIIYSVKKGMN